MEDNKHISYRGTSQRHHEEYLSFIYISIGQALLEMETLWDKPVDQSDQ